ncbi:hypothetical protein D1614_02780 [Maribellus luteus]|uniref:Transposase DDE domain-containing protein n=1 Tax=Maribellus luteus TaxID=2305463 RepID=A0A399TA66_9BACT|nr:hypothetical protein D1614_02780 [Maribellus luteus]
MNYVIGSKLHFVINDKVEILNFVITSEDTYDREPLKDKKFIKKLKEKLYTTKAMSHRNLQRFCLLMTCT